MPEVADLVVLAWAALRRRAWFAYGAPIPTPAPGGLRPRDGDAGPADARAGAVVDGGQPRRPPVRAGRPGPTSPRRPSRELARTSSSPSGSGSTPCKPSCPRSSEAYARVGADPAADRLTTARIAAQLTQQLRQLDGVDLVRRLAAAEVPNETAVGQSLASAAAVTSGLDGFRWDRLRPLQEAQSGEGSRAESAAQVLERLRRNLESDEMVVAIQSALRQADDDLFAWLAPPPPPIPTPPPPIPTPPPKPRLPSAHGRRTLQADEPADVLLGELQDFRANHAGEEIIVEWRVE